MGTLVSVVLPVRDGGALLEQTLSAVSAQQLQQPSSVELIVCDSGSRDGSVALARRHGAEVIEIAPEQFSHGGTRNLLMEGSQGDHVAFVTQDATPSDSRWLQRLLNGFSLADDVGLAYGPYRPRPDASPMVARELTQWFRSISPTGSPRIDRLDASQRDLPARELLGAPGFFTDANGCIARAAWEQVPFRDVAYAEDQALAIDMLRAGFAKVYVPDAAVIHSHEYSGWEWLRRSFDEARALREIYGWIEPLHPRTTTLNIWGRTGADWRWSRGESGRRPPATLLARSLAHHALRIAGSVLGARAERLPDAVAKRLSLEQRGGGVHHELPGGL
jgi:glycosyltransferase involved in cell wall biosynthesis